MTDATAVETKDSILDNTGSGGYVPGGAAGALGSTLGGGGIKNFVARTGRGTGNQGDFGHYDFTPTSRNRQQLENAYRSSWISRMVVDLPAHDMCRAGVQIDTQAAPEDMDKLFRSIRRKQIWQRLCSTVKWSRLYGGGVALILIKGQNSETPLRLDTIPEDGFKGIVSLDRWSCQADMTSFVDEYGPSLGLPEFYRVSANYMGLPAGRWHHSRVIRIEGGDLPIYQKRAENGWGLSYLEPLWDRLVAFDSATAGTAQLVFKAHLRIIQIEDYRQLLAAGGKMRDVILEQLNLIRGLQTNEGLTVMDAKDKFEVQQYAFGGLSDVLLQLAQQLSGASQIPLVKFFGQSPAGLNATGESDIRNYYDNIGGMQEDDLREPVERIYNIEHCSMYGEPLDEDAHITFRPLWQMSDKEKTDIGVQVSAVVTQNVSGNIYDRATGLRELRQWSKATGMFTNITDEMIEDALNDPPPVDENETLPEETPTGEDGDPSDNPENDEPNVGDEPEDKGSGKDS